MKYEKVGSGEIRYDVEKAKPYVCATATGQEETYDNDQVVIHTDSWPIGTKFVITVPVCPDCGENAEFQDINGKCPCGFDWKRWAINKYEDM